MAKSRQSGKLAVILHADIAKSTSLVQQDEHLAHERIQDTFRRFSETIDNYHGHVREIRGDALLADFERASDAVSATLAFQTVQAEYIESLNDNILPKVRAGIAMGEVIIADNTVTGAGVVLAQRVEQLAMPGALCITAAVHEALPNRMPFDQVSLGEQQVKGFDEQIRVYAVKLSPGGTVPKPETPLQSKSETPNLPEKPSIAVLPFTNMSGDQEQEYFSDGISEDIITELSRFRELHVIARHSTFFYKGKSAMIRDIGESLKVAYVVEGSVRKSGDRIRITAQLVDAASEAHIWAERYDRNIDDVFEVQDEVTRAIVGILAGQVTQSSQRHATRVTTSVRAYDYVLRGQAIISESDEANQQTREMYETAISLDPSCARAHAGVARSILLDWMSGWGESKADTLGLAYVKAKEALKFDDSDPKTRSELGKIHMYRREFEQAEIHIRRALTLNPNDSDVMVRLAMLFTYLGKPQEGIRYLWTAKELNPFHPAWHFWVLGFAQYVAREYEQAVATLCETIESGPQFVTPHRHLAACYAQLDKMELARHEGKQILELDPNFGVDSLIPKLPFKHDKDRQHYLNALIKAGLPL
jgi:adenylate cyclase